MKVYKSIFHPHHFYSIARRLLRARRQTAGWRDAWKLDLLWRGKAIPNDEGLIAIRPPGHAHPFHLRVESSDSLVYGSALTGHWHLPPSEATLKSSGVIVDLGCNIGATLLDFGKRYPSHRLIGVELDKENFRLTQKNLAHLGDRVTLINAAVWHSDGQIQYGGSECQALHVDPAGQKSARAICLATLWDELRVERVAFLKMDIEGAEDKVVMANVDWLKRVDCLNVETHPPAASDVEIEDRLKKSGFCTRLRPEPWPAVLAWR